MNDFPASTETTAQERFVVIVALIGGLALFAWLLPRTFVFRDGQTGEETVAATPAAGEIWSDPDFPDASTSRIDDLEGRLAEVESTLGTRIDELKTSTKSETDTLQTMITGLVREIEQLKARLSSLEQQASPNEELRIQLIERIRFLEIQLGRLRNDTAQSRLFVENGESLGGKASDLFRRLQALAPFDLPALQAEYAKIDQEIPARPLVRVKYDLAESRVPEADLPRLKELLAESPEGTFFLVAGYADQSGDAAANRTLSSKRASNVAEILDRGLKPGQTVRAIYLGQTGRFGPPDENRVVEIWAIRP